MASRPTPSLHRLDLRTPAVWQLSRAPAHLRASPKTAVNSQLRGGTLHRTNTEVDQGGGGDGGHEKSPHNAQ